MLMTLLVISPVFAYGLWYLWRDYDAHKRSRAGDVSDRVTDDADLDEFTDPQSPVTEPYRTAAAAPSEPVTPPRRYCINCKHLKFLYPNIQEDPVCLRLGYKDDPVRGPASTPTLTTCQSNDNYHCPSYVAKKGK